MSLLAPLALAVAPALDHDLPGHPENAARVPAILDALAAAGIDNRTGSIRVGLEADLVAYDGDPLSDTRTFFEPRLVVSDGRIVVEGAGL